MSQPAHIPNHTIDEKTGFTQSLAYADAFTAERKLEFLDRLKNMAFRPTSVCRVMGIGYDTYLKHVREDVSFRKSVESIKGAVIEAVEQKLQDRALTDEGVADRIFFLKAWKADRYNPIQKSQQEINVNVNMPAIEHAFERQKVIEAEIVKSIDQVPLHGDDNSMSNSNPVDTQQL
jgi:hypothetical protein